MEKKDEDKQDKREGVKSEKQRISLLVYIGILFAVSVLVSMLLLYFVSGRYRFKNAVKESGKTARAACLMADIILKYEDPQLTLINDEKKRNEVHALFSSICAFSGLKYLYLYTVDENNVRHRLVIAASKLKEDREINKTAGYGSISTAPLYNEEKEALSGDVEGGYEIIDNEYGRYCAWFRPVFDEEERVIALIGADLSMDHVLEVEKTALRRAAVILFLIFTASFFLEIIMVRLMIIKPLRIISNRMKNFVHDRNCELPPDWMPFEENIENEVSDIANSFRSMGNDLNSYLSRIEDLTREQVANQIQMDVARNIQYGIVLPGYSYENDHMKCEGYMHAAKEVGGDFYDCFLMDNGKYCGFIGDVSDKGISAALFMVMTKTMLRDYLNMEISPAEAINRTNSELYTHNPEGMFVTVFAFVMDPETGEITYANAGHDLPLIISTDNARYLSMEAGTVIGLMENIDIGDHDFKLDNGQTMMIYTDGITDAVDKDGNNFGEERLKELFVTGNAAAEDIGVLKRVVSAVNDYSKDCEQFDDMTVITVTYKG